MWPALIILAASAFLKYQNDKSALGRQENLRRAMEAYQLQRSHENEAATDELVQKQAPKARAAELSDITANREQSLKDTVGAAQGFNAPPIAGKLSNDYRSAEESTAGRVAERTRRAIEQLATIGATGEQQQKFALRYGKAAGTVDASNRAISNVGRGYTTDIANTRPNPFINLLSQVGMGVGGGMLGGAGGAAAASAGTNYAGGSGEDVQGYGGGGDVVSPRRAAVRRGFSLWGSN